MFCGSETKFGTSLIECRDPGLTLEISGKPGIASKPFDTVAAAELLVTGVIIRTG